MYLDFIFYSNVGVDWSLRYVFRLGCMETLKNQTRNETPREDVDEITIGMMMTNISILSWVKKISILGIKLLSFIDI